MKKRGLFAILILVAVFFVAMVPVVYAWFVDTLVTNPEMTSHIYKSYFESGDGTGSTQYQNYDEEGNPVVTIDPGTGEPLESQTGCAYEIKYPIQFYYFAWLQALGYFNQRQGETTTIDQVYFYLSADLDMTGWVLPQIGTQTYPFVGNFDGNGHVVSNLTVQNVETSGGDTWNDKPEETVEGLNIVGVFGVVGSLNNNGTVNAAIEVSNDFTPTPNYTYNSAINEVKNCVIEDATIKTDLASSLVGVAAGFVNGNMENVKVVGGTLVNVRATTALTTYTTDLSEFGAVGYVTDAYKGSNNVTTVRVYDPQVMTSGGAGSGQQGGNNWGNSVDMLTMYTDLVAVYNDQTTTTNFSYVAEMTITHHSDGTTTTVTNSNGVASLAVAAGGNNYVIRVNEYDDDGDVIASYSLVQRPDGNTNFMYLYGETEITTQTQTIHHNYEFDLPSILIYSGTHYLGFNGSAFSDTVEASATQWVNDDGKLYAVRDTDSDGTPDTKYYISKSANNALTYTSGVALSASAPAGATTWTIDNTNHWIYNDGWYLCYKNGSWQLVQREVNLITESTNTHYLTVSGSPAAIGDAASNTALPWTKTSVTGGYYLSAEYNGTTYYLMCGVDGTLSLATSPASPTVWNDVAAEGNSKAKIYTLTEGTSGFALYYNGVSWATTGYSTTTQGNDWGGSVDFLSMNKRLWSIYGSASGPTNTLTVDGQTRRYKYYISGSTVGSVTFDIPRNSNNTDPTSTANVFRLTGVRTPTGATTPETVLPLIVADNENGDYTASSINTGYIVSGNNDTYGDVRVSSYPIKYLNNSLNSTKYSISEIHNGNTSTPIKPSNSNNGVLPIVYSDATSSRLEILTNSQKTYSSSGFARISDSFNEENTSTCLTSYSKSINESNLKKYTPSRSTLDGILKSGGSIRVSGNGISIQNTGVIHGLHFMGSQISNSSKVVADNIIVNGESYSSYELPKYCIDFNLKENGIINLFAGTYYGNATTNVDSFFSLWEITRDPNDPTRIIAITQISGVYYKESTKEIAYSYGSGAPSAPTGFSASDLVFDMRYLTSAPPEQNVLYYFEFIAKKGEYAMGSVSGSASGAYLLYLDISAGASIEGDSKFSTTSSTVEVYNKAGANIVCSTSEDEIVNISVTPNPTFYPLAWEDGTVADGNTGYVISGANNASAPPGDIRVSRYSKYATGNWASIRESLTSATDAGVLNNARVYTIVNGTQQTITAYGIGNQYTTNYSVAEEAMNEMLAGQQYVYGLHFMQSSISASRVVTVPKAVVNGNVYNDYAMPEDCIDFMVAERGRITFMAGTYFSGSSVNSFFSLHRIFRDNSQNITDIKELSGIYSNGTSDLYIYSYVGDNNYYYSNGTEAIPLPNGYVSIFDTSVIRSNNANLTMNSVYYFEIPVDAGEFALGSTAGDGAYLLYLDIAANAGFSVRTTITEVYETTIYDLLYPEGVAFVDDADSTAYDTNGKVDPEKSVFTSVPISNSNGSTVFVIDEDGNMTVTNGTSTLAGYEAKSIVPGGSLQVNNGAAIELVGRIILTEKVSEIVSNQDGSTVTTVTTTVQTIENGAVTGTTITRTVTTTLGNNSTTVNADPPVYDGHSLIPIDYTLTTPAEARTILLLTYKGEGLSASVARSGNLNYVSADKQVTINFIDYDVFDVVRQTDPNAGVAYGGTYAVTITGTAGTYPVSIVTADGDFVFTLNGNSVSVGDSSVTLP